MRLIYTINDATKARQLAAFLISQGIDNRLEMAPNTDWGSADYGMPTCRIWIYDEDQLDKALNWVEQFKENPDDPNFQKSGIKTEVQPQVLLPGEREKAAKNIKLTGLLNNKSKYNTNQLGSTGNLTIGIIVLCCIIFLVCELTAPNFKLFSTDLPYTPLTASPTKKELLYDYPHAYELLDKIVKLYGVDKLQNPQDLPPEGQFILNEFYKTPYWQGYYDTVLNKLRGAEPPPEAPLFEKIKEGQIWRLFTPALLHNDILHILFNMLWLVVLGKQIEQRLSPRRYLILILILGIFSNTVQYLMSGANFLGFSGILCGMLTFIWMRQKITPWEGYPLQRSTFLFMVYFVLAMLGIQLFSFFFEVKHDTIISPGIANAAHFAGGLLGLILGCLSFFSWKTTKLNGSNK